VNALVVVLASAAVIGALAAIVALVIATAALRRAPGLESAVLQKQIPGAIDSLRLEVRASLDGATQTLNQRLSQLSLEVDRKIGEMGGEVGRKLESTSGMIGSRLEGAAKAVADVHRQLGTVQGVTERVFEVGKEIASLQQILKAPKIRGGMGELFLGELLGQVLPVDHFELQYAFRGGQRVDAAVRVGDRLVPVDAKFPLENFARIAAAPDEAARLAARRAFVVDVKRRIDEIASRYILPDEGTFDFALMYIPAENVYYETILRGDEGGDALFSYSLERRVVPVSPNTLYSYLQVILLGLKGMRVEERAHEILGALGGLGGELERFRLEFAILGKHLEDAGKKYGDGSRRLTKLQESVERLVTLGGEIEEEEGAAPSAADAAQPSLQFRRE
jgi:DNA recombination protein RmuC